MPKRGSVGKVVAFLISLLFLWPPAAGAQISQFNWQPRPMQSGEIANIVISPSQPDIMYLGVEVNAHSFYKSKDGGKTWFKVDSGDHTKDVAVHPTNPDIAFYADSQNLWRTETGGERLKTKTNCDHRREKCATAFEKVLFNDNPPGPSETSFSSIAIAPSDPNIVYASVKGGFAGPFGGSKSGTLYKSTDSGKSFTKLSGRYPSLLLVVVDPNESQKLWIGSEDGVYLSTDGGQTVARVNLAKMVTSIDTHDGTVIFAASESGVLRSTDGGKNWQTSDKGLPSKTVLRVDSAKDDRLVVWATTLEGVAKSTDGGVTWQDVSTNLPSKNLQALVVNHQNPDIALVATETFIFSVRSTGLSSEGQYYTQGIYRTDDGGKTWARSDEGLHENNLIDITTHPSRPDEVWASQQSSRGLYRSRDAGQTWSLSPHLLTHYPMRTVFFPKDPTGNKLAHTSLHIGEDFGITSDSGVNWEIIHSEDSFFASLNRAANLLNKSLVDRGNLHLHGLAIDPKNPDIIYVGSVDDPSPFNEKPLKGSHIFKSTDGGKTWAESDAGYDHEYATSINDIKIDPQNTAVIYIGTTKKESTSGNGVWKSTDAGATWVRSSQGMPDNTSVSTLIIHPQKTSQLLAATYEGLYRSEDGGGSWVLVKHGQFKDIEFDPTNPEIVYTGSGVEFLSGPPGAKDTGEEGVFMSHDFGKTWANITGNLPVAKISTIGINSNGKILYAGVEGYGLYVVVDSSVSNTPIDQKVGVEKGKNSSRGANNHQNSPLTSDPGQGPPPLVVFSMIMGGIIVAIATVVVLVVWLNRRNKNVPPNS